MHLIICRGSRFATKKRSDKKCMKLALSSHDRLSGQFRLTFNGLDFWTMLPAGLAILATQSVLGTIVQVGSVQSVPGLKSWYRKVLHDAKVFYFISINFIFNNFDAINNKRLSEMKADERAKTKAKGLSN